MNKNEWEKDGPEQEAADAFIDLTAGLTIAQIARVLGLIAEEFERARTDAAEIVEEARAIRKLLESEG